MKYQSDIPNQIINLKVVFILILCAAPFSGFAQTVQEMVTEGDRVRVYSVEVESGIFVVQGFNNETLVLKKSSDESVELDLNSISLLEVSNPRSRGEGALRGLGIGFGVGAVSGAVFGFAKARSDPHALLPAVVNRVIVNAGVFGGIGGLAGFILGSEFPGERWERVELNIASTNMNTGAVISYTYEF